MQKTQHYQLNQWEPADGIERKDFNADNAAIDAALAAHDTALAGKAEQADLAAANTALAEVAAANCFVKLGGPVTTTTTGQTVTFDLSGVDMSEYAALVLLARGACNINDIPVYLNGSIKVTTVLKSSEHGVSILIMQPEKSSVYGMSFTGYEGNQFYNQTGAGICQWENITNIQLRDGYWYENARVILYGIRL